MSVATPTAQEVSQMPASHLAELERLDQTYWWHRVRWRIVRRCIRQFAGRKDFSCYFDIGSGGGGLPGLLKRDVAFERILLFDQHEVPLKNIGEGDIAHHMVDLERCEWRAFPQPDLITCLDVLEHLRAPADLLRALNVSCGEARPLLIVTVPAMMSLWSSWDEALGHYRRYSRTLLCQLLESAGWRVVQCSYIFHAVVLPLVIQRRVLRGADRNTDFPRIPQWVNAAAERFFWSEYLVSRRWRLPFGTSLIAVAR